MPNPSPQFDTKITSKDGNSLLFIRGPFDRGDVMEFEMRMVAVPEIAAWPVIWREEVGDEQA